MTVYNPIAPRSGKKRKVSNPPSNFSLKIELSDEMKEFLEILNSNIQLIAEQLNDNPSKIIKEAFLELASEQEVKDAMDEPAELSVNIPEPLIEPEKYGHIVYANELQDDFNYVAKFPALKWKEEENGTLTLEYCGSTIRNLTWPQIEKLVTIQKKARMPYIREVPGVGRSKSNKTAISDFCQCVEMGIIKPPSHNPDLELENNFSQFVREEDPDAAFKPMITPFYSTRAVDDGGKVEGSLEMDA